MLDILWSFIHRVAIGPTVECVWGGYACPGPFSCCLLYARKGYYDPDEWDPGDDPF